MSEKKIIENELTEEEKKENLSLFGVEDINTIDTSKGHNVIDGTEYNKNNPPLEIPTFRN